MSQDIGLFSCRPPACRVSAPLIQPSNHEPWPPYRLARPFCGRKRTAMYWWMCIWLPMPPKPSQGACVASRTSWGAASAATGAAGGRESQPGADQMAGPLPGAPAKRHHAGAWRNVQAQAIAGECRRCKPGHLGRTDGNHPVILRIHPPVEIKATQLIAMLLRANHAHFGWTNH